MSREQADLSEMKISENNNQVTGISYREQPRAESGSDTLRVKPQNVDSSVHPFQNNALSGPQDQGSHPSSMQGSTSSLAKIMPDSSPVG